MYAAAAGASLGSRQARKQQRIQNNKNQALLQQTLKDKLAASKITVIPKSRQFHQLPANYLRTPLAQARKLSASYAQQGTSNSRLLLPITESSSVTSSTKNLHKLDHHHHHSHHSPHRQLSFNQKTRGHHQHQQLAHHNHQHQHPHHQNSSPLVNHPHSHFHHNPECAVHGSYSALQIQKLTKSATASLPLTNLHHTTPPSTPLATTTVNHSNKLLLPTQQFSTLQLATDIGGDPFEAAAGIADGGTLQVRKDFQPIDPIIITPATPLPSPNKHNQTETAKEENGGENQLNSSDETVQHRPSSDLLLIDHPSSHFKHSQESIARCESPSHERKCSVYRARTFEQKYYYYDDESKLNEENETYYDSFEYQTNCNTATNATTTVNYTSKPTIKHESVYSANNYEPYSYDALMPNVEGGNWISAEYCDSESRHIGICTCDHVEIHDSSLGGSSDEEDLLGVLRGPSSFANAFLYLGLGTVAIGLVISFVGTGEKGFKTVELRLIGPSLIGIGLVCCILRILFCICPSNCIADRRLLNKKNAKVDADHTTSLLRGVNEKGSLQGKHSKRVQIVRGPNSMQKFPQTHSSHKLTKTNSKTMEGMEALRLATTSLLLQSDQQPTQSDVFMTRRAVPGGGNRVVPIINEPEKVVEGALRKEDSMSIDIYNLSDEEENEDNSPNNNISSPEEANNPIKSPTNNAAVGNLLNDPNDPGRSGGGFDGRDCSMRGERLSGGGCQLPDAITTINEKDHTEIEPGGGRRGAGGSALIMDTGVDQQFRNQSNSNTFSGVSSILNNNPSNNSSSSKLMRQRAPVNNGSSKKGFDENVVESMLMETSLCINTKPDQLSSSSRPSSKASYPINLPNAVPSNNNNANTPVVSSVLTNFSISDNKSDLLATTTPPPSASRSSSGFAFFSPTSASSSRNSQASSSYQLSANFGSPVSTVSQPQQQQPRPSPASSAISSTSSFSSSNYSFLLNQNAASLNVSTTNANSSSGNLQAPASELVLSPAKLGQ